MSAGIESVLVEHLGANVDVASVSRRPGRFAGVSPVEVVTVGLRDGADVTLFVKHLGAEQSDHPDKLRRDREPLVYRRLLAGHELPVPTFYGSRWNPASRRHELFLEHVDDWSLKYHGLEHWATAARRLAGLHAAFADRAAELARSDFLLALDRAYFGAWADRARAAAGAASAALGSRLERALGRHREVAGLLAAQPPTLVHNDLAPKNVIADTSTDPARICFVDWEMAGVGCGLLDLAHLMHGLSAHDERLLCAAYRGEPGAERLALPDPEFARVLAACKLQNTLFRLAHIEAWDVGRETAALWVEDVARLQAAI